MGLVRLGCRLGRWRGSCSVGFGGFGHGEAQHRSVDSLVRVSTPQAAKKDAAHKADEKEGLWLQGQPLDKPDKSKRVFSLFLVREPNRCTTGAEFQVRSTKNEAPDRQAERGWRRA
jgi:hypothetical protein